MNKSTFVGFFRKSIAINEILELFIIKQWRRRILCRTCTATPHCKPYLLKTVRLLKQNDFDCILSRTSADFRFFVFSHFKGMLFIFV
jgi:hypothetical protein